MKRKSEKERRAALRERTKNNAKNKESMGKGGKSLLDLSDYPDISYFKPKKNKNCLDIIPWVIETDNHPQGMEAGLEDYILDIWVHYSVGPMDSAYVCLERTYGKPCPICEERKALRNDENADESLISRLIPKHRAIYNVIDLNDEGKGIQLFNVSHWNFERELVDEAETAEEEIIVFSDIKNGRSVKFRATEVQRKGFRPYFEFKSFSFEERDSYDESIYDEAVPLDKILHVPTYDEVKAAFLNISLDENESEPKSNNRKSKKVEEPPFEPDDKADEVEEEEENENPDLREDLNDMSRKELRSYIKENDLDIKITKNMEDSDIVELILEKENEAEEENGEEDEGKCPHGYIFGEDLDEYDECNTCDNYDECSEAF